MVLKPDLLVYSVIVFFRVVWWGLQTYQTVKILYAIVSISEISDCVCLSVYVCIAACVARDSDKSDNESC